VGTIDLSEMTTDQIAILKGHLRREIAGYERKGTQTLSIHEKDRLAFVRALFRKCAKEQKRRIVQLQLL